jgi:putative membrane protein
MKTTTHSTLRGAAFLLAASLGATLAAQNPDPQSGSASTNPNYDRSATPTNSDRTTSNDDMKHHDKAFLEKAAKGGMKEVAVSQVVAGRLANPQVRDFANHMVTEHTAVNNEVMALAAQKGVVLPDMTKKDQKLEEKWSDKSGDLEKKYVKEMIEDHEETIKLFEKAAKSDDADVAAFAQKTLPALMHHLTMAKDLKKNLNL